ncbi:MAG: hydroxyacid dehydrogenase [Woeseiaceae bacterium]|nr:hydroxyacid dehydrogenase [Woeseiaceae bacterium]
MPDIVISEFMDEAIARETLADFDLVYDPTLVDDRDALLASLADARAIVVRNRTIVDQELLDRGPHLKVVGRLGVGLDNIDLAACQQRGVAVCPATGANDLAVAEYVITAAFVLLRQAWQANNEMIAGKWPRTQLIGCEAAGKRLGLIGLGSIAREVAARARALGMSVAAFDPYVPADEPIWNVVDAASLPDLASQCDVISVHVPLTDETRNLVDAEFIAGMRDHAMLINTARGGVINEAALIDALRNGRLGGAALDVFESEPLDAAAGAAFGDLPNLLLTPHIAGITAEANLRVSRVTAQNVADHLRR